MQKVPTYRLPSSSEFDKNVVSIILKHYPTSHFKFTSVDVDRYDNICYWVYPERTDITINECLKVKKFLMYLNFKGLLEKEKMTIKGTPYSFNVVDADELAFAFNLKVPERKLSSKKEENPMPSTNINLENLRGKTTPKKIYRSAPRIYNLVGHPQVSLNTDQFSKFIAYLILKLESYNSFTVVDLLNKFIIADTKEYNALRQRIWLILKEFSEKEFVSQTKTPIREPSIYTLVDKEGLINFGEFFDVKKQESNTVIGLESITTQIPVSTEQSQIPVSTKSTSGNFPAFPSINDIQTGNQVMDFIEKVYSVYSNLHTKYEEAIIEIEQSKDSCFGSEETLDNITLLYQQLTKENGELRESLSETSAALLVAKTTIKNLNDKVASLEDSINRNQSRRTIELKPLG